MPANRSRFRAGVFLCLGILAFACILSNRMQYPNSIAPVRSLTVTIDKSQREELFEQLRKFSKRHSFKYELTDFNTNGEHYQVWMANDEIQIIASDTPGESNEAYIGFYGWYPSNPLDEGAVDELLDDLKSFINEIPNVTIAE